MSILSLLRNHQDHAREGVVLAPGKAHAVSCARMANTLLVALALGGSLGGAIHWFGLDRTWESPAAIAGVVNGLVQAAGILGWVGVILWPLAAAVVYNLIRQFTGGRIWLDGYLLNIELAKDAGLVGTFLGITFMLGDIDLSAESSVILQTCISNMSNAFVSTIVGIVLNKISILSLKYLSTKEEKEDTCANRS